MMKRKVESKRAFAHQPLDPKQGQEMQRLLTAANERLPEMLRMLAKLVRQESPSDTKGAVDQAVDLVAGWCEEAQGSVKRHRQRDLGDLLQASFPAASSSAQKPILILGHLDTVWEVGTLKRMPYIVNNRTISGPGVLDMKAGVVMALTAIQILRQLQQQHCPVIVLLHSDEEIGSPASRPVTEQVAATCEAVYVLEPAQGPQGAYKTARKSVGKYRLDVSGIAAHSGVDFVAGHSAIIELSHQIEKISGFTDIDRGITVNPGVISGGTRSNVIAAGAWVEVDVRAATARDAVRIHRAFERLKAHDRKCSLHLSGGLNRPPMERTRGTVALFRRAQQAAGILGFSLEEASTGGGSDGNFTAALGIPTLDGMGAVGAGAHASHEHILIEHLAPRTALLAAMLGANG